jgi:hypothetical protein
MQRQHNDNSHRSIGFRAWGAMLGAFAWAGGAFRNDRSSHITRDGWHEHSRCSSATQRRVRKEQKLARRMQRRHDPYFRAARA